MLLKHRFVINRDENVSRFSRLKINLVLTRFKHLRLIFLPLLLKHHRYFPRLLLKALRGRETRSVKSLSFRRIRTYIVTLDRVSTMEDIFHAMLSYRFDQSSHQLPLIILCSFVPMPILIHFSNRVKFPLSSSDHPGGSSFHWSELPMNHFQGV